MSRQKAVLRRDFPSTGPRSPWMVSWALLGLALLVRWMPLNRYITPDEPIWVQRSVAFADAVAARDWAAIPQTGHPGLTTMALGALGVRLSAWLHPAESAGHLAWIRNIAWLAPENEAAFPHLAFFLPTARFLVMLVTAGGIVSVYGIGCRRLGARAARFLACFLALDPFFGGLSGLLHTDALQALFVLLATLLVLPRRDDAHIAWWSLAASALCLALAGMTKTLGLFVAPGIALALFFLPREPWPLRAGRVAVLTILTVSFYLLLYPPVWVNPHAALTTLIEAARYHEGIGLRDVFFLGQYTADPGPLFYPLVLLFRLTPPVLGGLGWALFNRRKMQGLLPRKPSPWWFIWPTAVYLAFITVATKKFDRYALSAIVLLTAIAASAWACCAKRRRLVVAAALLLPWALVAPLPLYYANPLLGGPWLARQIIPLGWGESDGIAALYLARRLPEAASKVLLTANVPGSAAYFPGTTWRRNATLLPCADALIVAGEGTASPGYVAVKTLHLAGLPLTMLYTQTLTFPTTWPLVVAGPLPGAPTETVAPAADLPTLRSWLESRLAPGAAFLWVHAPQCYPLTETQLTRLFAGTAQCAATGDIAGLTVEQCRLSAPLADDEIFLARFGGTLDLIAAAWPPTVQAPSALTVHMRWLPI